jgi:hypothetical protein
MVQDGSTLLYGDEVINKALNTYTTAGEENK